jgi:phospholipase/carboxylesterase
VEDRELDDLLVILPPLLQALDGLGFIGRYLGPGQVRRSIEVVGAPDVGLQDALRRLDAWPERLAGPAARIREAGGEVIAAFEELRGALEEEGDMRGLYRSLRHAPRAQEALYPLARGLPPVSRFFLEPSARNDVDLQKRLAETSRRDDVGVFHVDNEPGSRGGFSLYVPETYAPEAPAPLVMALHGGSGNGRAFLWTWLRDARSHGAILVSPTARGDTWALSGPDIDTPNLVGILDFARSRWSIDPARLLMTGMSDGGTFSYVSGLEAGSPFTHLAPVSASFHPILAEMADRERLAGLPIHITHGALDWMFGVDVARQAQTSLSRVGARVTYREIDDLSHTYPREINPAILAWLAQTPAGAPAAKETH